MLPPFVITSVGQALGLTSLNNCFQWQLVKTKPKPRPVFLRIGPEPESGFGISEKKIVKIGLVWVT
jgi:hypothetical protein